MGASKRDFADVRMSLEYYNSLDDEIKCNMEFKCIHCEGWLEEYKKDKQWIELDKKSKYKDYKAKQKREYEIRHNQK